MKITDDDIRKITDDDIRKIRETMAGTAEAVALCTLALPYDAKTSTRSGLPFEAERTRAREQIIGTIERAITVLGAYLVNSHELDEYCRDTGLTYAYHAAETRSWWLVSVAQLYRFGHVPKVGAPLDYDTWAETDSTAQEYGKRAPERAA